LPWLLVGMGGSAVATAMMARFETALAAHIAIAFFIPAVVYLADAIGTQSEAIAVLGVSLSGARLGPVLAEELATGGILIGITLGSLAYPLVWLGFGSNALAAMVAIALVVASSVATIIGLLLPALFAGLATIRRWARGRSPRWSRTCSRCSSISWLPPSFSLDGWRAVGVAPADRDRA
jgi:magnesium transporter